MNRYRVSFVSVSEAGTVAPELRLPKMGWQSLCGALASAIQPHHAWPLVDDRLHHSCDALHETSVAQLSSAASVHRQTITSEPITPQRRGPLSPFAVSVLFLHHERRNSKSDPLAFNHTPTSPEAGH